MKKFRMFGVGVMALMLTAAGHAAQTPAAAAIPNGATGKCNDGSYTSVAKKWQACGGHKGVQSWFAAGSAQPASASPQTAASAAQVPATAPATAPAAAPSAAPAAAPAAAPKARSGAAKTAGAPKTVAPGGGPGLVWVNTDSKIYHCPGTTDYGTTKVGKYMSEADAKAAGARPNRNVPCTK